jgi:hypothetical protein
VVEDGRAIGLTMGIQLAVDSQEEALDRQALRGPARGGVEEALHGPVALRALQLQDRCLAHRPIAPRPDGGMGKQLG